MEYESSEFAIPDNFYMEDWARKQLSNLSSAGKECLFTMWQKTNHTIFHDSLNCHPVWDGFHCWDITPANTTVVKFCSEIFPQTYLMHGTQLDGIAMRACLPNGTWSQGIKSNYDECANSFDQNEDASETVRIVQYIIFYGSIISLLALVASLGIFFKFTALWCDKVKILVHLDVALLLRSILLIVVSDSSLFEREAGYRSLEWLCRGVVSFYLFVTLVSVYWMFIFGHFLNTTITVVAPAPAVSRGQFLVYYVLGWLIPAMLLVVYILAMLSRTDQKSCFKGYSNLEEIWIVLAPMYIAIIINFLFLINIVRVVCLRKRRSQAQRDSSPYASSIKAACILFFVLGVNNLLIFIDFGGITEKVVTILNALFGSTQGITVSYLYCFSNPDVKNAIRSLCNRVQTRRRVVASIRRRNQIQEDYV